MIAVPLKVLMIGNSFSICVLNYAPPVAKDLGCGLDIASLYIGGCSLERHSANIAAGGYGDFAPYLVTWNFASLENQEDAPFTSTLKCDVDGDGKKTFHGNIPAMLAAEKWDIVTIQQASHESWRPESFYPWADIVVSEVRKHAPQAKIMIQQTWSYCNGDGRICNQTTGGAGSWGFDQSGMFTRLSANYGKLAEKFGAGIIPTGDAIQRFRAALPVKGVDDDVVGNMRKENGHYVGDSIHLNRDGDYLQACVWVATLFGADLSKLGWAPEKEMRHPENAALIRKCAAEAVGGLAGK